MRVSGLVVLFIINMCEGLPIEMPLGTAQNWVPPPTKVLDFMTHYGYLEKTDGNSEALYTEEGITDVIKLIQRHGAIPQTGILDNTTLQLITSPRCGVPDINRRRSKRFVIGADGWDKRNLNYFIANWSPRLGKETVRKNIKLALDIWGRYGRLNFREVNHPDADIIIAFGRGYHGDRYPFDGPGNILAHAYYPNEEAGLAGDAHFDDDEHWSDTRNGGDEDGIDFFTVALHELGHSLGLAHSLSPNAVMFAYYKGFDSNTQPQLDYDDILGMYELYIRRNIKDDEYAEYTSTPRISEYTTEISYTTTRPPYDTPPRTTRAPYTIPPRNTHPTTELSDITTETSTFNSTFITTSRSTIMFEGDFETVDDHKKHDPAHSMPPNHSPSLPDICQGNFDAVAALRNELFIFKDEYIWRLKERGTIVAGYPIFLRQMFPNLPSDIKSIDAAYERSDGMIILFTGQYFWVYDGQEFVENSPRPLTDYGLPTYLDKIDAVQVWGRNGKTYFYRKDRYWRYSETSKSIDEGSPFHMELWRGVPHNLNAVTTWKDGITYFFKDELFWVFDNDWINTTDQSPLPAPQVWLGCPENEQTLRRLY